MKREIRIGETSYEFVVPIYVKGDDVIYRSTNNGNKENENT